MILGRFMMAMDDSRLDDDGLRAEREPHVVQRIEVERDPCFDGEALDAQLRHGHRLEDHDFANELAQHRNALELTLFHGWRLPCGAGPAFIPYKRWGGPKAAPEIATSARASCAISIAGC